MSQVQSGILPEHCRAAIWIEANVVGDKNALREGCRVFIDKLATLQAKFPDAALGAVVAFGHDTWRELSGGEGAQELKNFTPLGKGLAPATQFDVLIHILSVRHDVNFSVAQAALAAFGDALDVKEETHGFRWVEDRDLSGFVDGTENPAGDEIRRDVAKSLKIVRQSLPYGTASGTHGLYFCAYCARLYNIEQQLLSMFGDADGKRDAMLRFTKPVTGGYYFAPSVERLLSL